MGTLPQAVGSAAHPGDALRHARGGDANHIYPLSRQNPDSKGLGSFPPKDEVPVPAGKPAGSLPGKAPRARRAPRVTAAVLGWPSGTTSACFLFVLASPKGIFSLLSEWSGGWRQKHWCESDTLTHGVRE